MSEFRDLLVHHFSSVRKLQDEELASLETHYRLLSEWNDRMNLTSTRDVEEMVLRHYCESLFVATQMPTKVRSAIDIGSGAGFPGIPVSVLLPQCQFTLLESNGRKCVFLRESSRHIPNVQVVEGRAESTEGHYDCVLARAVTWKEILPDLARRGNRIMLLVSGSDSQQLMDLLPIHWGPPIPIPWGRDRVLLDGNVPRET